MIIYFNSNGDISSLKPERVYQGSNDVDQFLIVAPFNTASTVELTFTLPNGQVLSPYILSGGAIFTNELNIWSFLLKSDITRFAGQVRFGVRVLGVNGKVLATGSDTFVVERGTAPTLPPEPTPDVYEQILELLGGLSVDKVDRVDVSDPDYIVGYTYSKNGIKTPNAFYYNFNADSVIGYNNQTLNNIKGAIFVLDIPTQLRQIEYLFADDLKSKPKIFTRQVYYDGNKEVTIVTPFVEIGWDIYGDLNNKITDVLSLLGSKQDKTDNSLQTTSKQVVGAINENKTNIENNYNVLNNNKLDKNFNLLVERTYAQLADFVAVRSGDQTLKMTLQTLRTYLTQGLVGLSFQIMESLPLTGVGNIFYLIPMVDTIEHFTDFADFPSVGEEKKLYIADDEHTGGATGWYNWDIDTETYVSYNLGYLEYIWLEEISKFELIGSAQVDLTGYATETWVISNFVTKTQLNGGTTGQILAKKSDNDLDFEFVDKPQAPIQEIQLNGVTQEPVDGVVDLEVSGKKYATIVIGTSTAGYTASDVDYLCDGVDDQIEIQSAIDSLIDGGVIKFLNGNYNISDSINIGNNIELFGNGATINQTQTSFSYYCFYIPETSSNILIDGFKLSHAGALRVIGILGYASTFGVGNIEIKNNKIVDPTSQSSSLVHFISSNNFNNINISNNSNIGSNTGVKLYSSQNSNFTLYNCNLSNNIKFSRPNSNAHIMYSVIISNNELIRGGSGSYFDITSGHNIIICNNIFGDSQISTSYTDVVLGTGVTNASIFGNARCGLITDNGINNFIGNNYFSNSVSFNKLQVDKIPTSDNDVVRKIDLDAVKNLIPTQVNRYFTLASQTLFLKNFLTMQAEKPTGVVSNKDTTITATTQATAQQLAIFTTADAIVNEVELPAQNTEVNIQAYKTSGNQNIHIFARGYVMDNAGNETLLSTSNIATLTTSAENYTLFLPLPEYTAPIGSRAVIEILAYRVSGAGTHTARISVDDDTMSRWSYNLSLGDLKLDAKNILYNNLASGLTATNVQDAIDELDNIKNYDIIINNQSEWNNFINTYIGNSTELVGLNTSVVVGDINNFPKIKLLEGMKGGVSISPLDPAGTMVTIRNSSLNPSIENITTFKNLIIDSVVLDGINLIECEINTNSKIVTTGSTRITNSLIENSFKVENCIVRADMSKGNYGFPLISTSSGICNNEFYISGNVSSTSDFTIIRLSNGIVNNYIQGELLSLENANLYVFYDCGYGTCNRHFITYDGNISSTGGTMTKWSTETND